jgi:hypothetical protein
MAAGQGKSAVGAAVRVAVAAVRPEHVILVRHAVASVRLVRVHVTRVMHAVSVSLVCHCDSALCAFWRAQGRYERCLPSSLLGAPSSRRVARRENSAAALRSLAGSAGGLLASAGPAPSL